MSPKAAPMKVVAKASDVIDVLAAEGALTPSEVAARVRMPRSSVYRLVDGLVAVGLVEPIADGRLRLSLRWLGLADAARRGLREWRHADEVLERLVEQTGQTSYLSLLVDERAVCIEWRRGRGVDVLAFKPGLSLPLSAGAAGRVMLAYGVDIDAYLARASLPRLTPYTVTDPVELKRQVALTRERGYALSHQDVSAGITAIGVPIFGPNRVFASACVSIGGLSRAFGDDPERFAPALRAAADQLGASMLTD